MQVKGYVLAAFVLVALIQLYVPASMILGREKTLSKGTEYRFRTAPVDPSNPFMGKFVVLSFEETVVDVPENHDWKSLEEAWVLIGEDEQGFAIVEKLLREPPSSGDYFKVRILYAGEDEVNLEFPFDRYYMEESKAYEAEQAYSEAQWDAEADAWAVVCILDGEVVLENVMIGGVPVIEVVLNNRNSED